MIMSNDAESFACPSEGQWRSRPDAQGSDAVWYRSFAIPHPVSLRLDLGLLPPAGTGVIDTDSGIVETETDVIATETDAIDTETDVIENKNNVIDADTDAINTGTDAIGTGTNAIDADTDDNAEDDLFVHKMGSGKNHIAVLTAAGMVWTLGSGSEGQLGNGRLQANQQLTPVISMKSEHTQKVYDGFGSSLPAYSADPIPVRILGTTTVAETAPYHNRGLEVITALECSENITVAVANSGVMWYFGEVAKGDGGSGGGGRRLWDGRSQAYPNSHHHRGNV
jgi:hypothetical protein